MLGQLKAQFPLEGCGIMAGSSGRVRHLYTIDNRLESTSAYEMDPEQQVSAMLDLESNGWQLLAIYHSHPYGPETPSATDVARDEYPEAAQIIVSFRDHGNPVARAFTIAKGVVGEIPFRVG